MRAELPILRRCGRRGFTLLEVLVAAALTVFIVTILLMAMSTLVRSWNRMEGRLRAASRAERVFEILARDLEGAMCRADGGVWLAATVQATADSSPQWIQGTKPLETSLAPLADPIGDARFGVSGVWLRLFTTRPGIDPRTGEGPSPVAVGYRIVRRARTPGSAADGYQLYRGEATALATEEAGFNLVGEDYARASTVDGAVGNLVSPPLNYLLAENVIDFGVRFYSRNGNSATGDSLTTLFPTSLSALDHFAKSVDGPEAERMPAFVDVMIRFLSDDGARQIAALEHHQIEGDWWAIAAANSYVFTRRIAVLVAAH